MKRNSVSFIAVCAIFLTGFLTSCTSGPPVDPLESNKPLPSLSRIFFFYPNGTASQNLGIFKDILEKNGAGTTKFDLDRAFVSLVDTGFSLDSITHTALKTKTGEIAESISVAVLFKEECLIGQFSRSWIEAIVTKPTLSGCLIGDVEKATVE